MINFTLALHNPFSSRWETVFYRDRHFSKIWKTAEIQVTRDNTIINFEFRWSTRCDHAGLNLAVGLFGYNIDMSFVDTRHWDRDNNCWEKYD